MYPNTIGRVGAKREDNAKSVYVTRCDEIKHGPCTTKERQDSYMPGKNGLLELYHAEEFDHDGFDEAVSHRFSDPWKPSFQHLPELLCLLQTLKSQVSDYGIKLKRCIYMQILHVRGIRAVMRYKGAVLECACALKPHRL